MIAFYDYFPLNLSYELIKPSSPLALSLFRFRYTVTTSSLKRINYKQIKTKSPWITTTTNLKRQSLSLEYVLELFSPG